jgi:hypothetical protein
MAKKNALAVDEEPGTAPDLASVAANTETQKPPANKDLPMRLKADHAVSHANPGTRDLEDADAEKLRQKAARRAISRAEKVASVDIPPSMKHYIVIQSLDDEEIDRMVSAWKSGRVVRHGSSQWGEEDPSRR